MREDDEYDYLRFQKLHKKRHRWNSTAIQFVLFLIIKLSSWKKLRYCCNGSEIGISYQAELTITSMHVHVSVKPNIL